SAGSLAYSPRTLLWYVERGVAREEPRGDQLEPDVRRRHHGPLFGARNVRDPHRVPHDDVLVRDGFVVRRPRLQPAAAETLIRVHAAGVHLAVVIPRHPHVVVDEAGAPTHL